MTRSVIITGGTRGIGLATVRRFLTAGDRVLIAGIDSQAAIDAAMEALAPLGEVSFVSCDVTRPEDCASAVETAKARLGSIDVLVNVAGVVEPFRPLSDLDLAATTRTIAVNLMGTIHMAHHVAKIMLQQRSGVIVNVGSICGTIANFEGVGYHASKGGVRMATQAMARELAPSGIRVLSVAPGWVRTGAIDAAVSYEAGNALHMRGRILEASEIADTIHLLTLPEARAINGTTVMADDGYSSFKGSEALPTVWDQVV